MSAGTPAKKNATFTFNVALRSATDSVSLQSNPTLAAGDVKVSTDNGAFANITTLPTVSPASGIQVLVTASASEMNGDDIGIAFVDQTSPKEWCDLFVFIKTSTRQVDDLAYPTTSGRSIDVTAGGTVGIDWANVEAPTTAVNLSATNIDVDQVVASVTGAVGSVTGAVGSIAAGGIAAASFAAGAINAAAIAADAIGASELAADAVAEIADAVWDEDATGHQTGGTFGQAIGDPGADTTTIYQSVVTDAAGTNIAADIVAVQADTDDIQTRLPAALVSGRIDASVGAMAANVLTATAIASDAITAAKIAADAIGASELAADVVNDIWMGTALTESYAANAATGTPAQLLYAIHQMLMQFAISGTSLTVKKLDNATTAFTVTLDDATSPTSAVRT